MIHTVTLKQTECRKRNKKIAAAVYLYQADNDGEWGNLRFDFESGTAEIVKLADWDTVKSNIFAKTAIRFVQGLPEARLLKSVVVPFEMGISEKPALPTSTAKATKINPAHTISLRQTECRKTGETITSLSGTADIVKYDFGYEIDPVWEAGNKNIPGIYIEFKEPWLNPKGFEQIVYDVLANTQDMNIIEKPEPEDTPFYINNGTINVGNTNGKVILQTFSLESLVRVAEVFQGKVPMCFLLWKGTGATDLTYDDPLGYASFINLGVKYKAHFIGPCIAGAPNDYPELDQPWQDYLIHRAKMKNHPYTFDTYDQMAKYFGQYNFGVADGMFNPPYLDALFTNHSDMSINYMITHGWRKSPASQTLVDAREVLRKLGYLDNN